MKTKRNYQLDFLKFLFTICIFLYHARVFAPSGTLIRSMANKWGWFGVHFFFIVSGVLMVNSHEKRGELNSEEPGKSSLQFVLRKFKSLSTEYYIAFAINFIVYFVVAIVQRQGTSILDIFQKLLFQSIPEFLAIQMSGIRPTAINSITWYISAMLLAMLPLYYLLSRNKDFFLHVFSPLVGIGLYGMFFQDKEELFEQNGFYVLVSGGFLRACCGICMGVVAWLIAQYIRRKYEDKNTGKSITILELFLSIAFLWVWLSGTYDPRILYPAMLVMPILVGIIFSQKSWFSQLFQAEWLSKLNSLSLSIYLNHYAARKLVETFIVDKLQDYRLRYLCMIVLTMLFCGLYYFTKFFIGKIQSKKTEA